MIGIYKITNPNDRVYIGQSNNIKRRFNNYFNNLPKKQTLLLKSFLKHGVENHKFEVIEECSIELLNERERYWQDFYDVLNGGLNCRLTETNDKSGFLSQQTKNKISNSHKGKKKTAEHVFKIALKNKGRTAHNKGKKASIELKNKLSLAHIGNKLSEETKRKMSDKSASAKIVLDINTGVFYKSAKEISELYNIKHNTLICKLTGKNKNNTGFIYV